jgi:hypothetical protein
LAELPFQSLSLKRDGEVDSIDVRALKFSGFPRFGEAALGLLTIGADAVKQSQLAGSGYGQGQRIAQTRVPSNVFPAGPES